MADPVAEQTPDLTDKNPFQLIAYLLFKVRHSIEDEEEAGRAPRWVRISRARTAQGSTDYIGLGVKAGINGFAEALSYLMELTLDIKEILVQTDAGKALVEVSADLIKGATDDNFVNGVRNLIGEQPGDNPLSSVGEIIDQIKGYMDYIPEPDDVNGMGHELYRLLCIEQLALPKAADGSVDENKITAATTDHLAVVNSGKVRLMQWAFGADTTTHGLGPKDNPESDKHDLSRMGSRRLWQTDSAKLPESTLVSWGEGSAAETMVEFFFDDKEQDEAKRTLDLVEVHTVLEKLGYTHDPAVTDDEKKQFTAKLTTLLRRFQVINGLPKTGELDNGTLDRLMHMDFESKNIRRAKPFDPARIDEQVDDVKAISGELRLVNPAADAPEDEGLALKRDRPGYGYYIAGRKPEGAGRVAIPEGGGWISDSDHGAAPGFVAMQSRIVRGGEGEGWFDGGRFSEGEASSGLMFFAARHTEPWKAGRTGTPDSSTALFGGVQPADQAISRLYQWVKLEDLQNRRSAGYDLYVKACVLCRSLYTDRNRIRKLPDQGRIFIELYNTDGFSGDLGTRRDPAKAQGRKETEWFPPHGTVVGELSMDAVARKRNWHPRSTDFIKVPAEAKGLVVALEGLHQSAWDTDAYFDDVKLYFEFRKA